MVDTGAIIVNATEYIPDLSTTQISMRHLIAIEHIICERWCIHRISGGEQIYRAVGMQMNELLRSEQSGTRYEAVIAYCCSRSESDIRMDRVDSGARRAAVRKYGVMTGADERTARQERTTH